jgi:uncharacterized protein (DUF1015 family)
MAIIAPFRGLTYGRNILGDAAKLIAPPYDVISEYEQNEFYRIHPKNVIRLILGKRKKGDSDWDNRYTRSADDFKRWQSEDVLVRAGQPCMYVTSVSFDPGEGNGPKTRWGLIALVRIEEEHSGVVLPHERTFSAHKDDRLKLTRACNAQFSQIFGLYEDRENQVLSCFRGATEGPPAVSFDFKDGTSHKMWVLEDPDTFRLLGDAMTKKAIFIADGHHRYETARIYRNMMRTRYGFRPANRAYEFVMMYLTNMDDPGLIILPSHRLVKRCPGFDPGAFRSKIRRWFELKDLRSSNLGLNVSFRELRRELLAAGKRTAAIGFHRKGGEGFSLMTLKPGVRHEMGDDLHESLKNLDVLVLSRFILQKGLGFSKEDLDDEEIFQYQSSLEKALSLVTSGDYELTFLLNPTRIEQVKEVASHGLIMPRKSTYFYPKVIAGLVFNKIDPYEIIQVP